MCKIAFAILLVMVISIFACVKSPTNQSNNSRYSKFAMQEAEECQIHSAVIDSFNDRYGSESLLIVNETRIGNVSPRNDPDKVIQFLRKKLPDGMSAEIVDDFQEKNLHSVKLKDCFKVNMKYALVGKDELQTVGDWDEFYKKYPGSGIVELSRVGFNKELTQAVVYVSSTNGSRSGWGYYVFLTKENSSWQIRQRTLAWVS